MSLATQTLWTLEKMAEEIRIWQIEDHDKLKEIKRSRLDLEKRLEVWLEKDISTLSEDLLVIGRQVETDHQALYYLFPNDVCTASINFYAPYFRV